MNHTVKLEKKNYKFNLTCTYNSSSRTNISSPLISPKLQSRAKFNSLFSESKTFRLTLFNRTSQRNFYSRRNKQGGNDSYNFKRRSSTSDQKLRQVSKRKSINWKKKAKNSELKSSRPATKNEKSQNSYSNLRLKPNTSFKQKTKAICLDLKECLDQGCDLSNLLPKSVKVNGWSDSYSLLERLKYSEKNKDYVASSFKSNSRKQSLLFQQSPKIEPKRRNMSFGGKISEASLSKISGSKENTFSKFDLIEKLRLNNLSLISNFRSNSRKSSNHQNIRQKDTTLTALQEAMKENLKNELKETKKVWNEISKLEGESKMKLPEGLTARGESFNEYYERLLEDLDNRIDINKYPPSPKGLIQLKKNFHNIRMKLEELNKMVIQRRRSTIYMIKTKKLQKDQQQKINFLQFEKTELKNLKIHVKEPSNSELDVIIESEEKNKMFELAEIYFNKGNIHPSMIDKYSPKKIRIILPYKSYWISCINKMVEAEDLEEYDKVGYYSTCLKQKELKLAKDSEVKDLTEKGKLANDCVYEFLNKIYFDARRDCKSFCKEKINKKRLKQREFLRKRGREAWIARSGMQSFIDNKLSSKSVLNNRKKRGTNELISVTDLKDIIRSSFGDENSKLRSSISIMDFM